MLRCSISPDKFTKGKVCISCGKAYCEKETLSECPFCEGKLVEAHINEEAVDGNLVQWLFLGPVKVGLVDFEEIPSFLLRFVYSKAFKETKEKIVLFPSKRSSRKFASVFTKKSEMLSKEYEKRYEKSRYTILYDDMKKEKYVLLNLEAIPTDSLEFLLSFILRVFSQGTVLREVRTDVIKQAFSETLFNYVQNLGIPFVTVDEYTMFVAQYLPEDLVQTYTEYSVLKSLLNVGLNKVSELIRHKIDLLFAGIEYKYMDNLLAVYDILKTYIRLASHLALAQECEALEQYVTIAFQNKNEECKKKLKEFPDILKCINIIIEGLSNIEIYTSYESFLESVASVLKQTFSILQPRYLRISEALALFHISQEYKRKIENNEIPYLPKFGSLEEFTKLLRNIFQKEHLFPELRIISGQTLIDLLEFRLWQKGDFLAYFEGIEIVQELALLIQNSIPGITKRLGKVEGTKGYLGYHDACIALVAFSQFAQMLNDRETASKLVNISKRIADEHNVLPMIITHAWKDFTETHDYEKLLNVYKSFLAIDFSEHKYIEPHLKTIGHLASAIFESEKRQTNFDKAEKYALEMIEPMPDVPLLRSYSEQSIRSSQAMYLLVRLFRHILNANEFDTVTNLKEGFRESQAMSENISDIDPFNMFALKTRILYALYYGNFKLVQETCRKLKERVSHAPLIQQFVEKVQSWCLESLKLHGRRFLMRLEFNVDEHDPWERVFKKIATAEMIKDAEKNIVGADAIVFVEGISDARVFEEFTRKLIPHRKIVFMDAEGFTNMNYFSEAKLAKSLKVPLFVLFDGDTSTIQRKKRIKDKLVKQIALPEDHVLTLNKNSIEDYLLVPTAIKRAFPSVSKSVKEINMFFKIKRDKRDKRQVLNDLFRQLALGKYDHGKAACIASKMKASEIDEEIKNVLDLVIPG